MALMACQAPHGVVTLNRSAVAVGRRAVSPPSAFFAPGVHAAYFSEGRSALLTVAPRAVAASRLRKSGLVVRGLFGLGVPELAVIAGVAALVFGPKQLPELGKKLGQSVKSFQQAAKEFETEVRGDSEEVKPNAEVSAQREENSKTITPTPVATPSGSENKSSSSS